jgi:hypothetical protein
MVVFQEEDSGMARPSGAYVTICVRYARWLGKGLHAEPGDWLVNQEGDPHAVTLVTSSQRVAGVAEILVPSLERLLAELAKECASFVIDYSGGEFACVAFDEQGRSLANVVASDASAAVAQALVFIRAERATQERATRIAQS